MAKTPTKDESWHAQAEIALLLALRANQPISYDAFATLAQIPSPHRIHKLTQWLEILMAEDAGAGRPLRACIVISKHNDQPAKGFFDKACALGLISAEMTAAEQESWYYDQRQSACKAAK